jgi:hypothetical protein
VSVSSPISTKMFDEFSISKDGSEEISLNGFETSPVVDF